MGVGTWSNTVSCLVLQSVAFIVFAICIVGDLRYRRGISVEIKFKMHLQYFIISLLYNKICLDILYWSTGCRLYCIFAVFCDARFFTKECIAKIAVIQFHTLQQLHKSIWHNNLQSVCFSSIYSPDKYASRSLVFHSLRYGVWLRQAWDNDLEVFLFSSPQPHQVLLIH